MIEKSISSKVYNPIWQSVLRSVELVIQSKIDNSIVGSITGSVSIPVWRIAVWNSVGVSVESSINNLNENT